MALTTGTFNSYFRYDLATKQITFTDTTDYVGQGTAAADVTIVVKNVTAPTSGTIYTNTNHGAPDIDPDVSPDSTIVIPVPTDVNGNIEQGLWSVTLEWEDTGASPATIEETKTFTLAYVSPTISIGMEVDCFIPVLKATDLTSYTVEGVNPTITRDFEINYPASMQLPAVTGTANIIQTNTFYTVTDQTIEHSSSLTSDLTYDFGDGWFVNDEIQGSEFIGVACPADICDIYCCIKAQYNRWQEAKSISDTAAQTEYTKLEQITSLAQMVMMSIKCGKSVDASVFTAQILNIANCDAGCGCSDGEPSVVTGIGLAGGYSSVVAGTGITVNVATGGDGSSIYTVNLNNTNVTKLSNLTNAIVAAGTNCSVVASAPVVVGGVSTITYTVNATDTVVETLLVRANFTMNPSSVPTITLTAQKEYGTTFGTLNQTPSTEFILNNNIASFSDWTGKFTDLTIGNFFDGSTVDYYPEVALVNASSSLDTNNPITNINVEIVSMSSSTFDIRFTDKDGAPVNGLFIQQYSSFDLIFKINA